MTDHPQTSRIFAETDNTCDGYSLARSATGRVRRTNRSESSTDPVMLYDQLSLVALNVGRTETPRFGRRWLVPTFVGFLAMLIWLSITRSATTSTEGGLPLQRHDGTGRISPFTDSNGNSRIP